MIAIQDKRPRTKPAEVRRDELMDAAQALFLRKGFAATSVSEIVEDADVAKGTFYLYFKTKDDVLAALRTRFVDGFCERVDAAMAAGHADAAARLDAWVRACVDAYLDNVAVHDLVFHQHAPSDRAARTGNPVVVRLAALIARGTAEKAWTADHAPLTAVMLFDALHGAVDHAIATGMTDRAALIGAVSTLYRRALGIDRG
ncbi:TetR/AcrR family transcriptional regulator [Methylobacterium sp. JK268]